MTRFCDLPVVLQDLVTDFAWENPCQLVLDNIETLLEIKSYNLPPLFFQTQYRYVCTGARGCKSTYGIVMPNPLYEYVPFWKYIDLFNIFRIQHLMYNLDFRKRIVKRAGSRQFWMNSFDHYKSILQFGLFYKILLASEMDVWTPTYKLQLKGWGGVNFF